MNLPDKQTERVHELSEQLSSLKVKSLEESPVKCTLCGAGYKTEAYLQAHCSTPQEMLSVQHTRGAYEDAHYLQYL